MASQRIQSLRGYRRANDEIFFRAMRREISFVDAKAASEVISRSADMFIAEKHLSASGVEDIEPRDHLLGEDGGAPILIEGETDGDQGSDHLLPGPTAATGDQD